MTGKDKLTDKVGDAVLHVKDLEKTYRIGFFRKRVDAVRGINFRVNQGEIFGLLGPNGAGKTTTIKMLLGLLKPSSGSITFFGGNSTPLESRRRLGYMPENPYVYQYLKPPEFLDLCGRLVGMKKKERVPRIEEMIESVGLTHAADRPIGKFSKGMMQRVGLAQALLHDPELLLLDEPMSGLDPIGRKEIRQVLIDQKALGKTLIFTSHILTDVEMLCDRVTILQHGKVRAEGTMDELLHSEVRLTDIEIKNGASIADELGRLGEIVVTGGRTFSTVPTERAKDVLKLAQNNDLEVLSVNPRKENLEDFFVRSAD